MKVPWSTALVVVYANGVERLPRAQKSVYLDSVELWL